MFVLRVFSEEEFLPETIFASFSKLFFSVIVFTDSVLALFAIADPLALEAFMVLVFFSEDVIAFRSEFLFSELAVWVFCFDVFAIDIPLLMLLFSFKAFCEDEVFVAVVDIFSDLVGLVTLLKFEISELPKVFCCVVLVKLELIFA